MLPYCWRASWIAVSERNPGMVARLASKRAALAPSDGVVGAGSGVVE